MGYPHHHIQSPMHGGSSIDPKFPPSTDDYHHHHHHHNHNGYNHPHTNGMVGSMPPLQPNNDYVNGMHHQSPNGMHANNYNYSNTISGHFYQHSYNSPQMHHIPTPAPAPPPPPPSVSSQTTNTTYPSPNNNAYYGSYYGSNSNHQMMDLPLQCPNTEPTNTVLGLHELGKLKVIFHQMLDLPI